MKSGAAVKETEHYLDVIKRLNPTLNAVLTITEDMAMEQARAADTAAAEGDWLGILHGVPMLIKDCLNVAGVRTTFGSGAYRENIATSDSEVVRRARKSGPVFLGKTNLSEWCYGATNQNDHYGDCFNPWDPRRIPGGSSGGAAAAVASGMCRIAIASDTGGSIRHPSALAGVAGLRPSYGSVSNTNALALSIHADTIGVMARKVEDVARGYAAVAGYDPEDVASVDRPVVNFLPTLRDGIQGMRIGLPTTFYYENLEQDIGERVSAAARSLEAAGATLVDVDLPGSEDARVATGPTILSIDMADTFADDMKKRPEIFGAEVLRRLRQGESFKGTDYAHALRILLQWKHRIKGIFQNVDLMLVPTCPVVAPLITNAADMVKSTHNIGRNNVGFGFAGLPCLSVPCGFNAQGLPIGMLLVASWFNEPVVFRAGVAYQAGTDFHRMRPKVSG